MSVKIETKVPMPVVKTAKKYPIGDMAIGDSFFVDDVNEESFRSYMTALARRHGFKLTVRKVEDGIRVWRVE